MMIDPISPLWPKHISPTIELPTSPLCANLRVSAQRYPDKTAIIYYGATLSYRQLSTEVDRIALFLSETCRVAPADRVVLMMQNCPHYIISYYATLAVGAVVVPVNPMLKSEEVHYIIENASSSCAIVAHELLSSSGIETNGLVSKVIVADYRDFLPDKPVPDFPVSLPACEIYGPSRLTAWRTIPEAPPFADRQIAGEVCLIAYTSGTTGRPKGCVHTDRSLQFNAISQAHWHQVTAETIVTAILPLFHIAGMMFSMHSAIWSGATIVVLNRWDRAAIPTLLERYGVNAMNAAPSMIVDLLADETFEPKILRQLRALTGGGAPMPSAVAERLMKESGVAFIEGYGLTETASPTHINTYSHPKRQCLGIPIQQTDCWLRDPETGQTVRCGEVGEIIVSGPQVFDHYWNNTEETEQAFISANGARYFRTGDLAYCDTDGSFFLVDRLKRMINVSGFKVWPAEVESYLYRHKDVLECCVVSHKDGSDQETVKALLVLREEATSSVEEIMIWCQEHMAKYKTPRLIEVVGKLPKDAAGKIEWRRAQM